MKKILLFLTNLLLINNSYATNPLIDYFNFFPSFSKEEQKVHKSVISYTMNYLQCDKCKWHCEPPNPHAQSSPRCYIFRLYDEKDRDLSSTSKHYLVYGMEIERDVKHFSGKSLLEIWDKYLIKKYPTKDEFSSLKIITNSQNILEIEWIYDRKSHGYTKGTTEGDIIARYELDGNKLIIKRFESRGNDCRAGLLSEVDRNKILDFFRNMPPAI